MTPADEATSAMDNITEEIVMRRVMDLLKDQTLIVIAHRLNSIRNFERIILLKQGRIIAQGDFDKLLENNGYFKDLYYASTGN